jgi:hypothetical protein
MEVTKAKATVAAVGVFIEGLKVALLDNVVDVNEWASILTSVVILGVTVWGVWRVPNKPVGE